MAQKRYEAQLDAIEALRHSDPQAALEPLRKALVNRSNYMSGKAATVAASLGLSSLIPDMLAALDRFYADGSDAQCWAKNALIDALSELGHGDSAVYLRGMRHIQMEAVWGGQVDTAGPLRARCAVALGSCRDLRDVQLLGHLVDALADPEKTVRAEAARAIGRVDRQEASLLVRLRALCGDDEPEVMGACFSAVLGIEGSEGIAFVRRFLDRDRYGDAAAEAALALGMTRTKEAFDLLKERSATERDPALLAALLMGIALTALPEAAGFLIELIARGERGASDALDALAAARLTDDDRLKLKAAVEASGEPRLRAVFDRKFR